MKLQRQNVELFSVNFGPQKVQKINREITRAIKPITFF